MIKNGHVAQLAERLDANKPFLTRNDSATKCILNQKVGLFKSPRAHSHISVRKI